MGTVQVSRIRAIATVHAATGGSTAQISVGATTGGAHRGTGSSTASLTIGASSGGAKRSSGGSTATVTAASIGGGAKRSAGGSTAAVTIGATGGAGSASRVGGSLAGVTITTAGGWRTGRSGGSTAAVTIGALNGARLHAAGGGSLAALAITTVGGGIRSTDGGSTAAITVDTEAGWTVDHPKEASGGSTTDITISTTTSDYIAGRSAGSEATVAIGTEGAGAKYIDKTFWRDITVTATVLESPWRASVLDSPWNAILEQPVRISAATTDYLVVRIEADVPLDMDPPFLGIALRGSPTAWSQGAWRGNTEAFTDETTREVRSYRLVEWLVGPESDNPAGATAPGIWRVYYDLRDLPTRSVEPAGTLVIAAA